MKFSQFAQNWAKHQLQMSDEELRLAEIIADRLRPDIIIGKGSTFMDDIKPFLTRDFVDPK
jgi:hypothetical protein